MSLKERITEDMKNAMRSGEKHRLGVIRLMLAAIKQREVDERIVLDDANVIAVTDKLIKQRKDSFSQFQAAGRDDLAAKEASELLVLQEYMPQQLSPEEVAAAVQAAVTETGAAGPQDMGRVMAVLKTKYGAALDMARIGAIVKLALAG